MFVKMQWKMPSASAIASQYRAKSTWLKQLDATVSRKYLVSFQHNFGSSPEWAKLPNIAVLPVAVAILSLIIDS
jgi:hypothetical protein